ncbi:MAG: helix-turn-helix domain-containing protein [Emcibacter sp.]|nr:helix-turn-helix domain-containing protein [Emcibacter sp.]
MVEVEFVDQDLSKNDARGGDTKQTISTVGQKLFQARCEKPDLDLEQISEELCIRPHLLAALEQDDFDKFPSACYANGFLKNYAAYLGLNVTQVIAQYKNEFQGSSKKVDLVFLQVEQNNHHGTQTFVSLMVLSALVLSGVWYSLGANDNLSVASLPDINEITSNILVSAIGEDQNPLIQHITKLQDKIVVQDVAETIVAAVEEEGQGYHLVQQVNATPLAKKSEIVAVGTEQVRLTVAADTWIRIVDGDSKILVDRILLSGEEFYLTDHKDMTLMTSNAGAISVFVDNVAVMPFGESGEILDNISLNKQNLHLETAQLSH